MSILRHLERAGLYILSGWSAAASELQHRGYSETKLKMNGPFSWGFTGKKGTAVCGGSFERILFSTSISESCFDVVPQTPRVSEPPRPEYEVLAEGLRAQLSSLSNVTVRCNPISPASQTATCTVATTSGEPVEVTVVKTDGDWKVSRPDRFVVRETLADSLAKELQEKAKASIVVDCGVGLFGYAGGDTLNCNVSRKGAKKAGSMVVTFDSDGGYKWKATGI